MAFRQIPNGTQGDRTLAEAERTGAYFGLVEDDSEAWKPSVQNNSDCILNAVSKV
ncbi:MAG: hypothetical protein MUC48_08530 [Leptolyngbya sp. Prado105]|nr:hypothetical protein [Leptolyngbya sp. Prado105]